MSQPVNIVDNVLFFGGGSGCGGGTSGGGAGGGGGGQGVGREGREGRGDGGANDGQGIWLMGGRAHVHINDVVGVVQPEPGQQRRIGKRRKNKFGRRRISLTLGLWSSSRGRAAFDPPLWKRRVLKRTPST